MQTREDLSRPIIIHVCKDGTISYRRRTEPVFNGRALPVFSVDTEQQAQDIQLRFGRLQHRAHRQMPGKSWYVLSTLGDGIDPALRGNGTLNLEDLDTVCDLFRDFYAKHLTTR